MNINIRLTIPALLGLAVFIAACSPATPAVSSLPTASASLKRNSAELSTPIPTPITESSPSGAPTQTASESNTSTEDQAREDAQGNVTIVITPLNLGNPSETLDFDVTMNTHSVNLDMDLAVLASLSTDTGKMASPLKWDAPMGGHHVAGTLSFPAVVDGFPLLDGTKTLTLSVSNVDAPERLFTWQLPAE